MLDTTSRAYKASPYYPADARQLQPIPMPAPTGPLTLESIVGAQFLAPIRKQKKISFHAVGDTGATKPSTIADQDLVAAAMVRDRVQLPLQHQQQRNDHGRFDGPQDPMTVPGVPSRRLRGVFSLLKWREHFARRK